MNTYTMILPPPNVTGTLHLGHALNNTLQDILAKYKKLKGFDVLWQPGTDHAGIATQMVVERLLSTEGLSRHDLGREKFLERVWKWKEESGGMIHDQQKSLNISLDWERSRFTMDEKASAAVLKAFVTLYRDGLIYRDKRLVNWDPKLQTAVSDLEVVSQDVKGNLYYIRYLSDKGEEIVVATTRPETLFGDVAVAVNPSDERYQHLIGQYVHLPLTDRKIPIIADDYCDPEFGTGAVKITSAHDFNDFEVGKRHNLTPINILTTAAHLNENVPVAYQGLSVDQARKKVLEDLGELLVKIEPTQQTIPHGDRSNAVIQPYLTDQWFLDAKTLAGPALDAVRSGEIQIIPENWAKTYFGWLENIQPWCISRQLWWGHQIPAWYGPDNTIFVAETEEEVHQQALKHYGHEVTLRRDEDVLDTWFSAGMWPFVTMGWPEETKELDLRYPSDVLVTGFDILFFWVARMIMMGIYFMKRVPFKTVYLHALVRDEKGQKMSKSKGNVLDPMELIQAYGADALRFTLASLSTPGRDIKIGPSRVELSRNFMTKIQNSAKFLEMNKCVYDEYFDPLTCKHQLNQYMYEMTARLLENVSVHLDAYRFDIAANHLRIFLWDVFCDFYIECLKPFAGQTEFQKMSAWVFQTFLKVLYPFAPELSEKLRHTPTVEWPNLKSFFTDATIDHWMHIMYSIRSVRGILGIQAGLKLGLYGESSIDPQHWPWIQALARLGEWKKQNVKSIPIVVGSESSHSYHETFHLYVGDLLDVEDTRNLLQKKMDKLLKDCETLQQKIANEAYKNARPDSWQQDNSIYESKKREYEKIKEILDVW